MMHVTPAKVASWFYMVLQHVEAVEGVAVTDPSSAGHAVPQWLSQIQQHPFALRLAPKTNRKCQKKHFALIGLDNSHVLLLATNNITDLHTLLLLLPLLLLLQLLLLSGPVCLLVLLPSQLLI
jgi:hypothetical protein